MNGVIVPPAVLHTLSREAADTGSTGADLGSAVWTAANRAIFVPFRLTRAKPVTKLFAHNGATASGNLDIGIYTIDGTRIVSTGSVAQSGTNVCQVIDITDTLLGDGDYYLALAMDGTTGTVFRAAPQATRLRTAGVLQQASAFPLPATATFAAVASAFLPFFGALVDRVVF